MQLLAGYDGDPSAAHTVVPAPAPFKEGLR
jgi:hypothetical protein